MITVKDQNELFTLLSKLISEDIECYAFGGTAMMFYGFKDETKDVDLLFETAAARAKFIEALDKLGFSETSSMKIYIPEKLREKHRPLMYKREDTRFDLFAVKILRSQISPSMKEKQYAVHEYRGKHTLKVNVLNTEHIVYLKAITERQNDFDDIRTILSKDKNFKWKMLIDEAVWQHKHGDSWAILDIGNTLKELKKYVFIQESFFKQLYSAQK